MRFISLLVVAIIGCRFCVCVEAGGTSPSTSPRRSLPFPEESLPSLPRQLYYPTSSIYYPPGASRGVDDEITTKSRIDWVFLQQLVRMDPMSIELDIIKREIQGRQNNMRYGQKENQFSEDSIRVCIF